MAAWPLLLLFYSSATLTAVVDSNKNKNNDARLKVSIRKDTMLGVPSCQHTFSQIELLNMVRSFYHLDDGKEDRHCVFCRGFDVVTPLSLLLL